MLESLSVKGSMHRLTWSRDPTASLVCEEGHNTRRKTGTLCAAEPGRNSSSGLKSVLHRLGVHEHARGCKHSWCQSVLQLAVRKVRRSSCKTFLLDEAPCTAQHCAACIATCNGASRASRPEAVSADLLLERTLSCTPYSVLPRIHGLLYCTDCLLPQQAAQAGRVCTGLQQRREQRQRC